MPRRRDTTVAIIGAGPAGIAAAIQLHRQRIPFVLIDRKEPGGLVRNANLVENYPGFPGGISGARLAARFVRHMRAEGVDAMRADVLSLRRARGAFALETTRGAIQAAFVVLATGSAPVPFTLHTRTALPDDGVVYDVLALRRARNKRIAIVGAGDVAYDYALTLSRHNDVVIVQRSDTPAALPLLVERVRQSPRITVLSNHAIVNAARERRGMRLYCVAPEGGVTLSVDHLVAAVGRRACVALPKSGMGAAWRSHLRSGAFHVVGDAAHVRMRQTAMCVGDGVRAAMQIAAAVGGGRR